MPWSSVRASFPLRTSGGAIDSEAPFQLLLVPLTPHTQE